MPGEAAKAVVVHGGDESDEEADAAEALPVENELLVSQSHLKLNGKPFSAVHPRIRIRYHDEPPEL